MDSTSPGRRIERSIVLVGLVASLILAIAPAAPALAGEVHFDPESPAGKEYALPLPQARNEALGGEGIGNGPPTQAPLFGVGIGGGGPGGGASEGGSQPSGNGGEGRSGRGQATDSDRSQGSSSNAGTDRLRAGETSSFSLGTGVGLLAILLLASLLLGLALRALSRTAGGRDLRHT